MDKNTVAATLGVGIRAVERYAEQGRLSVTYKKGKTRPVAVYDETEVKALKAEIHATQFPVRPALASTALAARTNRANAEHTASAVIKLADAEKLLSNLLQAVQNGTDGKPKLSVAEIAAKPLLKLDEAARLTGFGRDALLEAHEQGKLRMQVVKGAWRIKRTDLNAFIEKLF